MKSGSYFVLITKSLQLHGLISHWDELDNKKWAQKLIQWEEGERTQRSLARRLSDAHLGSFKDMVDFDWDWPKKCDQSLVEELMRLDFIKDKANIRSKFIRKT